MTLYLDLSTRTITSDQPGSTQVGSLTLNIPTTIDILGALVESVRQMSVASGYVSITIE